MPQKGLMWVNSRITSPTSISVPKYLEWYQNEHIPDVIATKQISSAIQYSSINASDSHPYLTLYPVKDINFLGSKEWHNIPTTSGKYFGGGKCYDVAEFDTRFYEFVEEFQKEGAKSGPANLIISAGLTPAKGTDEDFNAWYRDEHYGTLAKCTGYIRTRRYKLTNAINAKKLEKPRDVPTYLALHEFDLETLPQDELQKTAETEWAKRVMGSLEGFEVMAFKLEKEIGDEKANI